MSNFTDAVAAIHHSCAAFLYYPTHLEEVARVQLKFHDGVNKWFWRSWDDCLIVLDDPGYPPQFHMKVYENGGVPVGREAIIEVHSYLAVCTQPGTFKGTDAWLWTTLQYWQGFNSPPLPLKWAHFQYAHSNVGSMGIVPYPNLP